MKKNIMNYSIVGIYIAIMIIVSIVQAIAVFLHPEILVIDSLYVTFNSVVNLSLYLSLFLLFTIIFRKYFKTQFVNLMNNKLKIALVIILGLTVMMLASVTSAFILDLLGASETSENQESLNRLLEGSLFDKIALFSFAVLLVPLVEEMVFRKAILNMFHFEAGTDGSSKSIKIRKIVLATIAVLISSFAFGFIHVSSGDFIQIIYYAGLGAVLGIIYLVSNKNIIAPITVHFLVNLIVTTILFFG